MKRMPELPCPFHDGAICRSGKPPGGCLLFPQVKEAANAFVTAADQLLDNPQSTEAGVNLRKSRDIINGLNSKFCTPDHVM